MPPPRSPGTVCEMEDPTRIVRGSGSDERDGSAALANENRGAGPGAGFQWMVLRRHGRRPLAVLGRTLLRADNRCAGLSCWSEITIQETARARFAACLRHTPPRASDPAWHDAWLCDSAEAVRATLRAHDPLQALPPPLATHQAMPADPNLFADDAVRCHAETAWRFRAAWAGLLMAVFGLPDRAVMARSHLA